MFLNLLKTSVVRNSLFDLPAVLVFGRRVFDIQNKKLAKAFRLECEGFKPGIWKNKIYLEWLYGEVRKTRYVYLYGAIRGIPSEL